MSTREDRPTDDDRGLAGASREGSPIPDGGLSSAMPAWLRQPPAWKRADAPRPARTSPPPDASVIDIRTMLDVDDLPQWLRAVAQRDSSQATPGNAIRLHEPEAGLSDGSGDTLTLATPVQAEIQHEPVDAAKTSPVNPRVEIQPWWMSNGAIGGLLVAIILTMVYVVLVASGAF